MIASCTVVWRIVTGLCVLLAVTEGVTSVARADDTSAKVAADGVARLRQMIDAPDTDAGDRETYLRQVLDRRRDLINSEPDHPDVVFWCTAQAEDVLLAGIPMNALELTVRHGLPSVEQEVQLNGYVRDAIRYLSMMEDRLPAEIAQATSRQRKARLELLLNRRLPFLRGIAMVVAADQGIAGDAEAARRNGVALLKGVRSDLRGGDVLTVDRYVALGYQGLGELETAREMFEDLRREEAASPLDMVGFRLALVDVRGLREGPHRAAGDAQIAAATNVDPLERVLLVEQAARFWMEASRAVPADTEDPGAGAQRDEFERNAAECFLLLQPEQGGLNLPGQQPMLELMIEERLGRLGVRDPSASHLPVAVAIAAAVPLSTEPETAQQARDLLLPLVDRPGVIPRNRARALRILVQADVQAEDRPAAIEHAIMWSQVAADRSEAHGAAELAATVAGQLAAGRPGDESLITLYQQAINNLLVHFPDHQRIDRWRRRGGQLAEQIGQLDLARQRYEQVAAKAVDRPDALARLAVIAVRVAGEKGVPDSSQRRAAVATARREIARIASEFEEVATRFPRRSATPRASLELSLARLDLLEGDAIKALDRLSGPEFATLDASLRRPVHLARIEAAMKTGRSGAVNAVIDGLPEDLAVGLARTMLPGVLAVPSLPLPGDPILDPARAETAFRLARLLGESRGLDPAGEMLVIEGLRRGGDPGTALVRVNTLLEANPNLGDGLLSKAECLQADPGADRAETIAIYIRLSKGDESSDPDRFWTAQLRLLQSMHADGRAPESILAKLNRLEREHPELGGSPYVGQFAVLRGRLRD